MTGTALRRLDVVPVATAAALGISGALLIVFLANYHVPKGENGGTGPGIVTALGCLVLAGLLFGLLLPRLRPAELPAVVLSVIAVLSLAAFWSGATPVLAAAAAAAKTGTRATRRTQVARLIAVAAAAAAIVATAASSHLS